MSEGSRTKSGRKPRTVRCLLCLGLVQLRNDGEQRIGVEKFKAHMENEHGAYFDLEFILAASFMDEEEKEAVKVVIDAKDIEEEQDVQEVGLVVKMECESETEEGTYRLIRMDKRICRKSLRFFLIRVWLALNVNKDLRKLNI